MILIDKETLDKIYWHAKETYPYECCGIITGFKDSRSYVVHKCTNIQDKLHREDPGKFTRDSRTAYYIDPQEQFKIINKAEESGMEIKGFYHSHPDQGSYFSEDDKDKATLLGEPAYPGAFYIVISVFGGEIKEARCFVWNHGKRNFEEQSLDSGAGRRRR